MRYHPGRHVGLFGVLKAVSAIAGGILVMLAQQTKGFLLGSSLILVGSAILAWDALGQRRQAARRKEKMIERDLSEPPR